MLAGLLAASSACTGAPPGELPLVDVPASGRVAAPPGRPVAMFISGDGDWAGADRVVADSLAAAGIPVVGLRARTYLTSAPRDPEGLAADVTRVLREHLAGGDHERVILIGYSRGADLMPFAVTRLPTDLRERVELVALLGPTANASFTFHWVDLVRNVHRDSDRPVMPELEKMRDLRVVCVYGEDESQALCPHAPPGLMEAVERPGGHRIADPAGVARIILERVAEVP